MKNQNKTQKNICEISDTNIFLLGFVLSWEQNLHTSLITLSAEVFGFWIYQIIQPS